MESPSNNNNAPSLCIRGCGFFGSFTTNNMCSKCHRDHQKEEELLLKTLTKAPTLKIHSLKQTRDEPSTSVTILDEQEYGLTKKIKRCQDEGCEKKLTLAQKVSGKCKCGRLFCDKHRLPEEHKCCVDFKASGKVVLAMQNPLVVPDKLERM